MISISKNGSFHSVVAEKITKRMLKIYLGIYLLILLLVFLMVTPHLYRSADADAANTLSMMSDELSNAQTALSSYTDTLYSSQSLNSHLKDYKKEPSPAVKSLVEQDLSAYVSGNAQLLGATLEDMEHTFFSSTFYRNILTPEFTNSNVHYTNLFDYQNGSYFNYHAPEDFHTAEDKSALSSSYHTFAFSKKIYFNQTPYVISSYYNVNSSFAHCQNLSENTFSEFAVIDRYREVIYTSDSSPDDETADLTQLFDYTKTTDQKSTLSGIYYYELNPSTGWIFISFAPYNLILANLFLIISLITLLYIISPILYGLFLMPTTTRLLSPLARLHSSMKNYQAGDKVHLEINTGDEIEALAGIYNDMTVKIEAQITDIKTQEHINSVVNYKLLATQIDPHFIYNTMNIINIMARQGNTAAIVEINSALIKILRERLNSKLTISDTIENELETLNQYELIMEYRYENQIRTRTDVDETLLQNTIPKNILQPLVENAFYHGFGQTLLKQEGFIDVLIYSVDNELVIEVSDNGAGMSEERLNLLVNRSYHIYDDKKPHIGLDNIRQRLEYVYQDNYQFDIQSTLNFGTTISITIPLVMPD